MEGEGIVTYLVDRNINYTNACTINCQFCSFYRPPGHEEVYTQSFDQISARIRELEAIGGSRILMQGGVNPDLGLDYYVDLLKHLRTTHPTIDLDCFSPIEIHGIASVTGQDLRSVLTVLKDAGLHGLPGGGAEMLVPEVRRDIAPKKGGPDGWLEVMATAQSLGLITSATNVIGFGEDLGQRLEHMNRVRTLQDDALNSHGNGFTSFIAWPVQLETNVFGRRNRGRNRIEKGAGPTEYLRHVAVSRIFLDNVPHIQASWPTMGLATAQMALHGGADDIGSTMMEENVVSASGTTKVLNGNGIARFHSQVRLPSSQTEFQVRASADHAADHYSIVASATTGHDMTRDHPALMARPLNSGTRLSRDMPSRTGCSMSP